MIRLKMKAVGTRTIRYRHREMAREGIPMPSPSSAPMEVTDTEERINPRLMICRAVAPMRMVSSLVLNRCISQSGKIWHSPVPMTMMDRTRMRLVL